MPYWIAQQGSLQRMASPSPAMRLIAQLRAAELQPLLPSLHAGLRAWADLRLSPGPIVPSRVLVDSAGQVAFRSPDDAEPLPLLVNVGAAPDVAAWIVLLDKSVETQPVVATAKQVWTHQELATALPFVTPAFLPAELLGQPPDNWLRVARALAAVAAESDDS
jgi:hypothetical protein